MLGFVLLSVLAIKSALGMPDIDINVSSGLTPSISWTPEVAMSSIRILEGTYDLGQPFDRDKVMWWIESGDREALHSPISYGYSAQGISAIHQPRGLASGQTYTVYMLQTPRSFSGDDEFYQAAETFIARE